MIILTMASNYYGLPNVHHIVVNSKGLYTTLETRSARKSNLCKEAGVPVGKTGSGIAVELQRPRFAGHRIF